MKIIDTELQRHAAMKARKSVEAADRIRQFTEDPEVLDIIRDLADAVGALAELNRHIIDALMEPDRDIATM